MGDVVAEEINDLCLADSPTTFPLALINSCSCILCPLELELKGPIKGMTQFNQRGSYTKLLRWS